MGEYMRRKESCSSRGCQFGDKPYCCCAQGSIRFGYLDPSVRPSNRLACKVRIGISPSGSFAIKSEWTSVTVSLQRRNFVPRSRVAWTRRASKAPNAFFQDSYVVFIVSSVGLAVAEWHTPQAVSRDGCIPPYAYPESVRSAFPTPIHRGYPVPSEQVPSNGGSRIGQRDGRDSRCSCS
jgi:hypothetical protein